jgi:hypothetical protein
MPPATLVSPGTAATLQLCTQPEKSRNQSQHQSPAALKPCLSPHSLSICTCVAVVTVVRSAHIKINLICSQKLSQRPCLARVLVCTMQPCACKAKEIKETKKIRPTSKLGVQLRHSEHGRRLLSASSDCRPKASFLLTSRMPAGESLLRLLCSCCLKFQSSKIQPLTQNPFKLLFTRLLLLYPNPRGEF